MIETPSPAEVETARAAVDAYTEHLVRGDWSDGFAALAPESREHWGSLAAYSEDHSAFFESVGGDYLVVFPTDKGGVEDWVNQTYGATIDLRHAVLVEVDYPKLAGNNAGYNIYIVAPGVTGLVIYDVR